MIKDVRKTTIISINDVARATGLSYDKVAKITSGLEYTSKELSMKRYKLVLEYLDKRIKQSQKEIDLLKKLLCDKN